MMMTPSVSTALLFKDVSASYQTFSHDAAYLFDKEDAEWFNLAKRTFECTKLMLSVKFYAILQEHGQKGIAAFVDTLYDNARLFASLVRKHPDFELLTEPMSNIVCYRFVRGDDNELNKINRVIRQKILEEGEFYIVQTEVDGTLYLRNTMMNPFTKETHMQELLERIRAYSEGI